jgi:hypothetical protein
LSVSFWNRVLVSPQELCVGPIYRLCLPLRELLQLSSEMCDFVRVIVRHFPAVGGADFLLVRTALYAKNKKWIK